MTSQKRPYRKKRRAELEERTRLRITESAVALHGSLGPALTSISAIAQHAGVRRSTVYRHFPDEAALFAACSSHWMASNPLPGIGRLAAIADPDKRLRLALEQLYAYYRRAEDMLSNLLRDQDTVPTVRQLMSVYYNYLRAVRQTLIEGRPLEGEARQRVQAAIGHGLAFPTWRSLVREQGLDDAGAADLMCRLVAAAAGAPARTS
jgi:AcrR family transcriptional regulator